MSFIDMKRHLAEHVIEGVSYKRGHKPSRTNPLHHHDNYQIYVHIGGAIAYRIEHSHYALQHGDCLILRPDEYHQTQRVPSHDDIHDYHGIWFPRDILERAAGMGLDVLSRFDKRPGGEHNRIRLSNKQTIALMSILDRYASLPSPIKPYQLWQMMYATFDIIKGESGKPRRNLTPDHVSPTTHALLAYIHKHLTDPDATLRHAASTLDITSSHASRCFRTDMGTGFKEYQLFKRMAHAKFRLRQGDNVTDACFACGFNDYANFVKRFTQRVGMPPGHYAKASKL